MTREEEIKLVASCHIAASNEDFKEYYEGFIAGAKWADETNGKELLYVAQKTAERTKKEFINKACEWLKEKNELCMYELEMILGGNFIEDFKKAMEEQL